MNIRPPLDLDADLSPLQAAMSRLRACLSRQHDEAVKAALDRALGPNAWSLDTVMHRAHWQVGPNWELLHLDGRPLLRLSRPAPRMNYLDAAVVTVPGYSVEQIPWKRLP